MHMPLYVLEDKFVELTPSFHLYVQFKLYSIWSTKLVVASHTCNASTTAEGGTGQQREDTLWQPLAYTGTLLPRPLTHTYVHTERHSCRPNYWVWWSDLVRERACCQIWCPEFNPWKPHDWKRESNPASFLWSPQICFSTQGHGVRGKERLKRTKDKEKKVS